MLLRRVIDHVKKQHWTAIFIDFTIVVIGVGLALSAQQWLGDRQQRAELERIERGLRNDLANLYFLAQEQYAIAECRRAAYRELGQLLLQPNLSWPGAPGANSDDPNSGPKAFPSVFQSQYRLWTSSTWDATVESGALNQMDVQRRRNLADLFGLGVTAANAQREIYDLQNQLGVLANPLQLTQSDRLRYYDILAEADGASAMLEAAVQQIIYNIESETLLVLDARELTATDAYLSEANAELKKSYGDCVTPMRSTLLDKDARSNSED